MTLAGFPHSGISGSTPTCGSPKLIAAYRALHRLSVPRHPPCALLSLDRIMLAEGWFKPPRHSGPPKTHTRLVLSSRRCFSLDFFYPTHYPCFQSTTDL